MNLRPAGARQRLQSYVGNLKSTLFSAGFTSPHEGLFG